MTALPSYRHSQFFNALVVLPNTSHFPSALLCFSGVPSLTSAYLIYKSSIDHQKLKNLEAENG
jgi:hypothetical protein